MKEGDICVINVNSLLPTEKVSQGMLQTNMLEKRILVNIVIIKQQLMAISRFTRKLYIMEKNIHVISAILKPPSRAAWIF